MKIPERACRLKLDIQADTRDEMVRALEGIATAIDRSEMSTGCSGGVHSGWTYEYVQNPGPTHEKYQAQLKAYISSTRAAQETRPAHTADHDCACADCVKAEECPGDGCKGCAGCRRESDAPQESSTATTAYELKPRPCGCVGWRFCKECY